MQSIKATFKQNKETNFIIALNVLNGHPAYGVRVSTASIIHTKNIKYHITDGTTMTLILSNSL